MDDKPEPIEIDKLFKTDIEEFFKNPLLPGPGAFGSAPSLISERIEAICKRMEDLAKTDRTTTEQASEETLKELKEIYSELITVAKKVRALEQKSEHARSEQDLQLDLEREAQRRRQF